MTSRNTTQRLRVWLVELARLELECIQRGVLPRAERDVVQGSFVEQWEEFTRSNDWPTRHGATRE